MNKNNNFKIANVTAFESKSVYVPTFDAFGTEYYMLNNKTEGFAYITNEADIELKFFWKAESYNAEAEESYDFEVSFEHTNWENFSNEGTRRCEEFKKVYRAVAENINWRNQVKQVIDSKAFFKM